ncbi:helix-turn-helix domain-containing protein [Blautia sp.]|uniref:helix-turn-helix domain-containing protein n=1 Tax=Blautia sp. TaxID=1955243 RepID=UPI003AB874F5
MTFEEIAQKLEISTSTIRLCISKFNEGGIDAALLDDKRAGRPAEISDDAKAWMVSVVCQRPADLGYAQELWTLASLHKHIQKFAEKAGYPRLSTVTKPLYPEVFVYSDHRTLSARTFRSSLTEDETHPRGV